MMWGYVSISICGHLNILQNLASTGKFLLAHASYWVDSVLAHISGAFWEQRALHNFFLHLHRTGAYFPLWIISLSAFPFLSAYLCAVHEDVRGAEYSASGWQCLAHKRAHGLFLYPKLLHALRISRVLLKKNILADVAGRVLGRAGLLPGLLTRDFVLEGDRRGEFLCTSSGASLVKENLHPSIKYLRTFSLKCPQN